IAIVISSRFGSTIKFYQSTEVPEYLTLLSEVSEATTDQSSAVTEQQDEESSLQSDFERDVADMLNDENDELYLTDDDDNDEQGLLDPHKVVGQVQSTDQSAAVSPGSSSVPAREDQSAAVSPGSSSVPA